MVWLAKWLRENRPDARVLIITDRTERFPLHCASPRSLMSANR